MNTTDRSDIDRLVKVLRTCRYGSDISHDAANLIESLTEENFELRVEIEKNKKPLPEIDHALFNMVFTRDPSYWNTAN